MGGEGRAAEGQTQLHLFLSGFSLQKKKKKNASRSGLWRHHQVVGVCGERARPRARGSEATQCRGARCCRVTALVGRYKPTVLGCASREWCWYGCHVLGTTAAASLGVRGAVGQPQLRGQWLETRASSFPGPSARAVPRGCLKLLGCSCCCWPGNQELISYEMLGSLC